ncbi:MAG: LytR C-terminal domain-containing protein [Actinomycetota bacterium]
MGQHSSESQWPFYRSLIGWFLPWVLIAGVVAVGVVVAVDTLSGEDITDPDPIAASSPSEPSSTPTAEATPTPEASPSPAPSDSPTPKPTRSSKPPPEEAELITEGMTVQVLNGTGVASADDDMANRLAGLGYEVIAVNGSNKEYQATTVFWSVPESQEAAERLAQRFGWVSGPKPSNLSATVKLHVVVGMDEV